jgi:hypothetical protein
MNRQAFAIGLTESSGVGWASYAKLIVAWFSSRPMRMNGHQAHGSLLINTQFKRTFDACSTALLFFVQTRRFEAPGGMRRMRCLD